MPYWARSIAVCGCSMRTPMENGFGFISIPAASKVRKVSRALCPTAKIRCLQGRTSEAPPQVTSQPISRSPSVRSPVRRERKRTSPPSRSTSCRRFRTTLNSTSVPTCGYAS